MRDSQCYEGTSRLVTFQDADMGTEALTSSRIEVLKSMMGMCKTERPMEEEGQDERQKEVVKMGKAEMTKMAIKLMTLAATLSVTKAQEDEEEEEIHGEFYQSMMIYTILVVLGTLMIQALWMVGVASRNKFLVDTEVSLRRAWPGFQ